PGRVAERDSRVPPRALLPALPPFLDGRRGRWDDAVRQVTLCSRTRVRTQRHLEEEYRVMPEATPPRAADRDLLFGGLACHVNFVSREALLSAVRVWAPEQNRPLAQVLLAQGALRGDANALLEALVAKHLELHGNDPARSLAALNCAGPS